VFGKNVKVMCNIYTFGGCCQIVMCCVDSVVWCLTVVFWMSSMCRPTGVDEVLHTSDEFVLWLRGGNEMMNEECTDMEAGSDFDDDGDGVV